MLPASFSMVSSFASFLQSLFSCRYLLMGLVYTCVFQAFWLVSSEFETVTATVSWYLPAGIRLAAFLVCPYRAWPALVIAEKLVFFALFSPGAALDESGFMSGSYGWLIVHLVLSPAAVMVCVWLFRKYNRQPFFDNVNSVVIRPPACDIDNRECASALSENTTTCLYNHYADAFNLSAWRKNYQFDASLKFS